MSVAKITTVEAAARWIQHYLRDGPRPVPFRKEGHIIQQPLDGQAVRNVKTKAFREALKQLGVTTLKSGPKGGACWHMPVANSTEYLADLPVGLSENEWSEIGQRLAEVAHNNPWEIGAWLVYGEKNYNTPGDRRRALDLAVNATGLDKNTLRQYAQVAKNVNRLTDLSWKHHRAVVSVMPPQKRDELLNEAKAQGWSLNQLQKTVKEWKGPGRHSENFDEFDRTRERNRPAPPLQGKVQELDAALSEFNGFLDNGGHVSPTERTEICTHLAGTAQLIAELLERLESMPDTSPEQVQSLLADQDWPAPTSELPAEPSDPAC